MLDIEFENENKDMDENVKKDPVHEIRSITHGLLGYLDIFLAEIYPNLEPKDVELLGKIYIHVKRLSYLVSENLGNKE